MFELDRRNLYEELGPETIVRLATAFYQRVYADPDPWFRDMFPDDMNSAVRNQYEFFIQRFGGPNLYSERKGHPALRQRHADFKIDGRAAGRWLKHMKDAMDDVEIEDGVKAALWEFFHDTAHFLKNQDKRGKAR